jgi:hypothetical protein
MKIVLLHAALVLFLVGCGKSDQEISDELHAKIRGDWYVAFEKNENILAEYAFLSFEDTLVANQYACRYSHYTIQSDTLIIDHKVPSESLRWNIRKYKIVHIGKNWMKLVPLAKNERSQSTLDKSKDTLCLKKAHPKNNIKPTSVGFYIASTFGSIRPTYIEIKSNREIIFFEDHYENKISKKGMLNPSEYSEILRCIHTLPLNSLKDRYETLATDQCEYALTINYDNKQKHVDSYGLEDTPVELQLLFMKLYLLPTKCDLINSDTPLTATYFIKRNIGYDWKLPMELPPLKFNEPK